ncbi:cytochrome c biogenesis protein ResB [Aquabacterium sp. A7-Y]|nr:cytochrome c biogenesis protein ResB [Aquabacterium sp. A7-Y]
MRFAIALLVVICIASVVGTLVQQGQPAQVYVDQFGPFWSRVFGGLGFYSVYSAWWFLLILAILVVSTSLCVARHLPQVLVALRALKEQVREQSLAAHHHKADALLGEDARKALERVVRVLRSAGWQFKLDVRGHGAMLGAKKGSTRKIGYLLTHSAIVMVCLGGLVDSDLVVRLQMWARGLVLTQGGPGALAPAHRMSIGNPAFRAQLRVTEGGRSNLAVIRLQQGMLIQPLPFDVALKKFKVEYYSTGMPKLFASDIVIHDPETGAEVPARVEVNHPFVYRGVAIYQSSFADGGSRLKLRAWPLDAAMGLPADGKGWELRGTVDSALNLPAAFAHDGLPVKLELTELRVINVRNLGGAGPQTGSDMEAEGGWLSTGGLIERHLGAGHKGHSDRRWRNVGPSVTYRLRDAAGQAREFENYMLPVETDGQRLFVFGQRSHPGEPFRYLRIPADEQGSVEGWMRLRWALSDGDLRAEAARRYVAASGASTVPASAPQVTGALALFAGAAATGGFQALSEFLEAQVPPAERAQAAETLLRLVDGALFELNKLARERAGLPPLGQDRAARDFMTQATLALSDASAYGAPAIFTLDEFEHLQASVFQVTRAPGTRAVYVGCAFLVLGVFAMLYIRERRLWVWLQPVQGSDDGSVTYVCCALSAPRRTLDLDREFDELATAILAAPPSFTGLSLPRPGFATQRSAQ